MYSSSNEETQDSKSPQHYNTNQAEEDLAIVNNPSSPKTSTDKCYLPSIIKMPTSPDGTYTPPSPHHSLVRAVSFASNEEYQEYCNQYDMELGAYSDEWNYNKNGECGNWQKDYMKLHQEDRSVLAKYQDGEFPTNIDVAARPKFISYLCKEVPKDSNRGCGGLADRMGGKLLFVIITLQTPYINPNPDRNDFYHVFRFIN
jgi:hypothetical protein